MGMPITVVVGPLATADTDGISTSQKAAGAQALAINGALTDGTTADNICQSQTPSGAGNLTINGSLASSGVAYLGTPRPVYITSAGNDSGVTFTVTGTSFSPAGMFSVTETVTGANTSIVATTKSFWTVSQIAISGAAAAAVTVGKGGLATLDLARRVIVTSGGNDTGITFTVAGTGVSGEALSQTITGASGGAATTTVSFKTVTSVVTSGAVATTVQVGTNGVADSQWVRFDQLGSMSEVAIQATVSGTANFSLFQTLDDPNDIRSALYNTPTSVTWVAHPDSAVVNATATAQANYAYTPVFAKAVINSGTGTVTVTYAQAFES